MKVVHFPTDGRSKINLLIYLEFRELGEAYQLLELLFR